MLMHWYWCTEAYALMLIYRCWCTDAYTLLLIHWWWCTDADALMLMHWCWCTDAYALFLMHRCWCTDHDSLMLMHGWWCREADLLMLMHITVKQGPVFPVFGYLDTVIDWSMTHSYCELNRWFLDKILMIKREGVKYYFSDFVRKGGGRVTPHIRNLIFGPKTGFFCGKKHHF